MFKHDILISIVTYNSNLDYIKKLVSTINQITIIKIKLIIIDNLSSKKYFKKLLKINTNIISAGKNIGYGKANNLVEEISENSKYFLVLNPDIEFDDQTIINLFNFMENNKNYGLISPLLKSSDNFYYDFNRNKFGFFNLLFRWINKIDDKISSNTINELFINNKIIEVDYVSGSFMFFRRNIFKNISGFNNKFFMYFEDVEICDLVRESNSKIGILKESTAIHLRNRESYRSINMLFVHFLSFIKYKIYHRSKLSS